jgi:hypothetical protein
MAGRVQRVADRRVGCEKALSGGLEREPHLLPLALSDRQVAVFGAVIFPQAARVMELKLQLAQGSCHLIQMIFLVPHAIARVRHRLPYPRIDLGRPDTQKADIPDMKRSCLE